jgi:hypothetical protein
MTLWELLIFVVAAWVQLVQDKRYDEITTIKWSFRSIVPFTSALFRGALLVRVSLASISECRLSYSVRMYCIRDTFIRSIAIILTSDGTD